MIATVPEGLTKIGAGIVTVPTWTMASDGESYLYFWCGDWRLMTDAQMPTERFRSTERWQLVGVVGGLCKIVIPGCQLKAFVHCEEPPPRGALYRIADGS